MKISIYRGRDKSKSLTLPGDLRPEKVPVTEMKGVPVRVTTFLQANRTSGAEAVVILTRGSIRSFVARAGEMNVYLSPRAEFRCIQPDPPKAPLDKVDEPLTLCAACRDGCHTMCENTDKESDWCECVHSSHAVARGGQ